MFFQPCQGHLSQRSCASLALVLSAPLSAARACRGQPFGFLGRSTHIEHSIDASTYTPFRKGAIFPEPRRSSSHGFPALSSGDQIDQRSKFGLAPAAGPCIGEPSCGRRLQGRIASTVVGHAGQRGICGAPSPLLAWALATCTARPRTLSARRAYCRIRSSKAGEIRPPVGTR